MAKLIKNYKKIEPENLIKIPDFLCNDSPDKVTWFTKAVQPGTAKNNKARAGRLTI